MKPLNILIKSNGANVEVQLKGRGSYRGKLARADGYMNMMLKETKEYDNNGLIAKYGDVFIRGNNVMYVCIEPKTLPPGE
jgi:U6 snRNA-associated Sm-like protein LSm6